MEQRDYLLRQIEQLGQVLALMLERLLTLKQVSPSGMNLEEIKQHPLIDPYLLGPPKEQETVELRVRQRKGSDQVVPPFTDWTA